MNDLIRKSALIKAIRIHATKINSLYEDEETVVQIIEKQPTYVPDTNAGENVEFCEWTQECSIEDIYNTKCKNSHIFFDGGPIDNEYKYCPYCGRQIIVSNYPFDPEE